MTGRSVAPSPEQVAAAWSRAAKLVEAGRPAEAEADLRRSLAHLGDEALDDLPEKWNEFTKINADYFGR